MFLTKKVDKTPYELWHEKVSNLSYSKVWGCEALLKRDTLDKVESISVKCIFVRYPMSNLDLEVIQDEDTQPFENTNEHHDEVEHENVESSSYVVLIRRFVRISQALDRYNPEYDIWVEAMNVEMQSKKDNKVWHLVDLPPDGRTVGRKWLFKKKTDMDGNVHTFKVRLVAKGYTKTYGVDYTETFSPVVAIRAIRIILVITAFYDYGIWQMDVKTAFLNGHLSEDVYMVQPEGFKMENSKRGNIPMQEKPNLRKSQGASTPEELRVTCYTDAGFETEKDDRKYQSGYVFVLNGGVVDWKSVKHSTIAISSTEAEYIVASEAVMEAVWMRKFIDGLGAMRILAICSLNPQ
ncbi:zinc finger, CCHC-type containing protein [Tanacetum coccineum]